MLCVEFKSVAQGPCSWCRKEKEIYAVQAAQEGKKPEIAERIAQGRLEKFYGDACLLEQSFVKDSTKLIRDVLADFSKESGKDEDFCNAALAKACQGIAYGKYCGMKHPD